MLHPIILASRSPRRQEALAALGVPFEVRVSAAEESLPPQPDPTDPVPVAVAKAQDISRHAPDAVVLAGDTIVALGSQGLGKPESPAHAEAMLQALRGRRHAVRTGLALAVGGQVTSGEVACPVVMRDFSDAEIREYVASGEPLDCAGAYDVHRAGGQLVAEVPGCFAAVVGFPIVEAAQLLQSAGVPLPSDPATVCTHLYARPCPALNAATAHLCRPKA